MEITVISEEDNPMLHRTDVQFRVSHAEATPDRLAVRDSLAARLNKDADEVVIRRLDTKFGMRETVGEAKVYQGAEAAKDVEQVYMLARNKIGDAGAVAEPEATESDEAAEEEGVEESAKEADEAAEDEGAEAEEVEAEEADEAGDEPGDDEPDDSAADGSEDSGAAGDEADDGESGEAEDGTDDDEESEE